MMHHNHAKPTVSATATVRQPRKVPCLWPCTGMRATPADINQAFPRGVFAPLFRVRPDAEMRTGTRKLPNRRVAVFVKQTSLFCFHRETAYDPDTPNCHCPVRRSGES